MKLFCTVSSFFLLLSLITFYPGCGTTDSDNGTAVIKGTIVDSMTNASIPNAYITITSTNFSTTVKSDDAGNFFCNNLTGGTYSFTAKSYGYFPKTITGVEVPSDDTLRTTIRLFFTNIFIYNGIEVDEYITPTSNCAVGLDAGTLMQGNNATKDIQLIDTITTTITVSNLVFMSSDLDFLNLGKETKFSPCLGNFTKAQFDTITAYWGFSTNLEQCYPYKTTEVFDQNLSNSVYAFFLKGKSSGLAKNIYGIMHIESVGNRSQEQKFVRINIKINKNGENSFIINPQKIYN
jgi:hypothetical protein